MAFNDRALRIHLNFFSISFAVFFFLTQQLKVRDFCHFVFQSAPFLQGTIAIVLGEVDKLKNSTRAHFFLASGVNKSLKWHSLVELRVIVEKFIIGCQDLCN